MKICLFLPDLHGGGAERVALDLAQSWSSSGCSVVIVLMHADGALLQQVPPEVRLVDLRCPRNWTSLRAFARYVKTDRPDIIVSFMPIANGIAGLSRLVVRNAPPLIATEHNPSSFLLSKPQSARQCILRSALRSGYLRASRIVAVSKGVEARLGREFPGLESKIVTIHNPVNIERVRRLAQTEPSGPALIPTDKPYVVSVGRLVPDKDHVTLIRAFDIFRQSVPSRLLILGEDSERGRLEALIRRLGLEDDVILPGFLANPSYWMKNAMMYVQSSRAEGFALVLVEALALGLPIVSTDCVSGPREILSDGKFGRLVPVGDVDKLAEAMTAAAQTRPDRDPLLARARQFDVQHAASRYLALMSELTPQAVCLDALKQAPDRQPIA